MWIEGKQKLNIMYMWGFKIITVYIQNIIKQFWGKACTKSFIYRYIYKKKNITYFKTKSLYSNMKLDKDQTNHCSFCLWIKRNGPLNCQSCIDCAEFSKTTKYYMKNLLNQEIKKNTELKWTEKKIKKKKPNWKTHSHILGFKEYHFLLQ